MVPRRLTEPRLRQTDWDSKISPAITEQQISNPRLAVLLDGWTLYAVAGFREEQRHLANVRKLALQPKASGDRGSDVPRRCIHQAGDLWPRKLHDEQQTRKLAIVGPYRLRSWGKSPWQYL